MGNLSNKKESAGKHLTRSHASNFPHDVQCATSGLRFVCLPSNSGSLTRPYIGMQSTVAKEPRAPISTAAQRNKIACTMLGLGRKQFAGGSQVLQRKFWDLPRPSLNGLRLPDKPLCLFSTSSRRQHELPFPARTPFCACMRPGDSLLLVAATSGTHGIKRSPGNLSVLSWYFMNLHDGCCECQAGPGTFWPAGLVKGHYPRNDWSRMCHLQARRILSFANLSTVIVTNADNLQEIACFDVSPAQVHIDHFQSLFWSDDGSIVVVWAICSPTSASPTCSLHLFDVSREDFLGQFSLPTQCDGGDDYMSISWSPRQDLLAVDVSVHAKAAAEGKSETFNFHDTLLINVVTGVNTWTSSIMGSPDMQSCNFYSRLLSCSPDGRLAVLITYQCECDCFLVMDTRRLQYLWSRSHAHRPQLVDVTWTCDESVTTLRMPQYGHQLHIHQQQESFMVTEHCAVSVRSAEAFPWPRIMDGYVLEHQSAAPLPPSFPQVMARLMLKYNFHWFTEGLHISRSTKNVKLELMSADSGQVLGSWTMQSLLKQAHSPMEMAWWRMSFWCDDLMLESMEWSPDASHLLLHFDSFLLVLAFDAHLSG